MLQINGGKCHLLLSYSDVANLRISKYDMKTSECEKLLSVKFDNELIFEKISLILVEKVVGKLMH